MHRDAPECEASYFLLPRQKARIVAMGDPCYATNAQCSMRGTSSTAQNAGCMQNEFFIRTLPALRS